MLYRLAGEALAHAVALGGNRIFSGQEAAQTDYLKIMCLGTGNDPDCLLMFVLGDEAFGELF